MKVPGWIGPIQKLAINVFLIFHLIAITAWCVPTNSALVLHIRDVIRPYMLWSGLFQGWDMFAPQPRNVNSYIEAAIVLNDGQIRNWRFPRMEQLGLVERYHEERYRKFVESLSDEANSALWPDVARHIARLIENPSNPPRTVMLIRYWSEIPPPSLHERRLTDNYRARIFFEYEIRPGDLQ